MTGKKKSAKKTKSGAGSSSKSAGAGPSTAGKTAGAGSSAAGKTATSAAGDTGSASTGATLILNESSSALKEMNRMLIISFVEIFGDEAFNAEFDTGNFSRVEALQWIRTATIAPARRIVARLSAKANSRKEPVKNSTIKVEDKVLAELGTRQVSQTFRAALAIHSYASKDERVAQVFRNTFVCRNCSVRYLNAGAFIQTVLGGNVKDGPLVIIDKPTIFEVLVWFHCINMVTTAVQEKTLTLAADYRNGNIIGYVVRSICSAWDLLLKNISDESLSTHLLPYIRYNDNTGCFQLVSREDGFAPLSQKQSFIPSIRPMKGGGEDVDETAAGRVTPNDHAMRHVAYSFLYKLKKIILDSQIYALKNDQEVANYPPIKALQCASGHDLPFVFVELDDQSMATLGIQKPVPPALEVINVDDADAESVGLVTKIPSTVRDASLVFGSESLVAQPRQKRSMTTTTGGPTKRRKVGKQAEENDDEENNDDEIQEVPIKPEPEVIPLDQAIPALSEEFDDETQRAYESLQTVMHNTCCSVYIKPFDELAEAHSEAVGEDLENAVQLFFSDPPYNIRREMEKDNSEHDDLDKAGMKGTVQVAAHVLRPGGHVHLFTADLQFHQWYRYFYQFKDKHTETDEETGKDTTVYTQGFQVETKLHDATRRPGHFLNAPISRTLKHVSMSEHSLHAYRTGLSHVNSLGLVDYRRGGFVPTRHEGYTGSIDNIPRLDPLEKVYTDEKSESGRPLMLRPEQKSVALLQTIIGKYTQPGDLVFDPFAGSFSTGRACMLLPQHRRCVLGDLDPTCHKFGMQQLVEVYARQLLNEESDITGDDELLRDARLFLHSMDRINAAKLRKQWNTPPGCPPMQNFPPEVVHYLCTLHKDYSLYRFSKGHPMIHWSPMWRARFNQMDIDHLQAFELSRYRLEIRQSTIPGAGEGVFTRDIIPAKSIIGYYYGVLVYDNMTINQKNRPAMYGEGNLAFQAKDFEYWAMQLKRKMDSGETIWIYPAPFCVMRKVNDARYSDKERNRPTPAQLAANPKLFRHNNVLFVDNSKTRSFRDYRAVEVRAMEGADIPAGSELFADYGKSYTGFDK